MSFRFQEPFDIFVIGDDTVVNDDKRIFAVRALRMRIGFAGAAVCRPACVRNADMCFQCSFMVRFGFITVYQNEMEKSDEQYSGGVAYSTDEFVHIPVLMASSSACTLPERLTRTVFFPSIESTAMPDESYPRYSNRFKPVTSKSKISLRVFGVK